MTDLPSREDAARLNIGLPEWVQPLVAAWANGHLEVVDPIEWRTDPTKQTSAELHTTIAAAEERKARGWSTHKVQDEIIRKATVELAKRDRRRSPR